VTTISFKLQLTISEKTKTPIGKEENIRLISDSVFIRSLSLVKTHVESALRELSLESFAKFENELYQA
jgi:hypothetical protein